MNTLVRALKNFSRFATGFLVQSSDAAPSYQPIINGFLDFIHTTFKANSNIYFNFLYVL